MSETDIHADATQRESAALVWFCRFVIVVATALSIARLMQAEPLQSANDRSRWCTVRSLVELGTYQIDKARKVRGWDTIDLVRHDGHFYSTKPPLLSTIVAGLYWAVRNTLGWTLGNNLEATTRLILCLINVFPMTIALTLLLRMTRQLATSALPVIVTALTAGFGTLLLPFLATLNNHTPGALSVVFALYPLLRIVADGRRDGWLFAMCGFWAAFAFTCELPAAAFFVALAVWLALVSLRQTLVWFVPAALIPLAAFFATNFVVTGGVMPFYTAYGSELYEFVHEGIPSYWVQPRGIDKASDSFPVYLLHCVIGHHGLLSLTPIWLLTLIGWTRTAASVRRDNQPRESLPATLAGFANKFASVHILGAALTAVVLAFFMTRTANYNYGGVSVALRWMLWLIPFWLLAIPAALHGVQPGKTARSLIGCALAVSVFSAWYPFDGPWKQPWLFDVMQRAGWIDYSDPPPKLERPLTSWISRLPDSDLRDVDYWIELAGRTTDSRRVTLRVADGGPSEIDGRQVRIIEVTETQGEDTTLSRFAVDPEAFATGAGPDTFLVWSEPPDDDVLNNAVGFWTGVGQGDAVRYRAAAERYLRLPVRTDAFHCMQAHASGIITDAATDETIRQRCDVWVCSELPFGVAQLETQIIGRNRQVVTRQRLTVDALGKTLKSAADSTK